MIVSFATCGSGRRQTLSAASASAFTRTSLYLYTVPGLLRGRLSHSLGLSVKQDGGIAAVKWDGVAFRAGLANTSTIVAVNNRAYKGEVLKAAIK